MATASKGLATAFTQSDFIPKCSSTRQLVRQPYQTALSDSLIRQPYQTASSDSFQMEEKKIIMPTQNTNLHHPLKYGLCKNLPLYECNFFHQNQKSDFNEKSRQLVKVAFLKK